MRLSTLLAALPPELEPKCRVLGTPNDDPAIRGIAFDSRLVTPDDLFFALRGSAADGHDYLAQTFERGAAAAIVESVPEHVDPSGRPVVVVSDSRRALAPISTRFFGNPSSELNLIGITGTNGKTSTTYLIESILHQANNRGRSDRNSRHPLCRGDGSRAINTTPESCEIQRAPARDARTRCRDRGDGGFLPRTRIGAGRRLCVCGSSCDQPHPGPPGLSRHDGRLPGCQGGAVRSLPRSERDSCGEHRRLQRWRVSAGRTGRGRPNRSGLPTK